MKQSNITEFLQELYPEDLAYPSDFGKIGLQFGSCNKEIKKILIALDATSSVVEEAINNKCDLVITHHPAVYYPLLSLDYDKKYDRKVAKMISSGINFYSMHTNFDTAAGGMNDILANKIGLFNIKTENEIIKQGSLMRIGTVESIKLEEFVKFVINSLGEDGAKFVGNPDKIISKVGIVGGAGGSELAKAIELGCDCYITGEIHHHQALEAVENEIAVIEVSHFVESVFKNTLKRVLSIQFPDVEIMLAKESNPFNIISK